MPEKSGVPASPSAERPAEPKPPSAIDAALPPAPPATLVRAHKCNDKQCRLEKWLPDVTFSKAVPGGADSPGTLWIEELAPNAIVSFPRHTELEVLGVVLAGKLLANGDEGGKAFELAVWGGLRAPGAGLSLKAGDAGAKIAIGLAAKTGNLAEATGKKAFAVSWKKRPAPLAEISFERTEDLAWAGGAFHARLGFGSEGKIPGSLGVLRTSRDALIQEHDHPSWEHIAILDGKGTMTLSGKDHPVAAGAVFDIPPGEKHSFTPGAERELVAIQMYTPSGPEQRFVQLAKLAEKSGPGPAPEAPAPKK
jgi:mannose-6-phosphate isomerase-like protein (cupin superfamily)